MVAMDPTPDRLALWSRAAQRALAADLVHRIYSRPNAGYVLVPSKDEAKPGTVYHVQLLAGGERVGRCDCSAGLAGKPCAHRAAVLLRVWERRMNGARITRVKPAGVVALVAALEGTPPAPAPAVLPDETIRRYSRRTVELV